MSQYLIFVYGIFTYIQADIVFILLLNSLLIVMTWLHIRKPPGGRSTASFDCTLSFDMAVSPSYLNNTNFCVNKRGDFRSVWVCVMRFYRKASVSHNADCFAFERLDINSSPVHLSCNRILVDLARRLQNFDKMGSAFSWNLMFIFLWQKIKIKLGLISIP